MDTRWLHDFLALTELRNFTRAAEMRNLSQAAFSRRIQNLEQWLGAKLIDRNAFPMQLTEAGERFLGTAVELTHYLAEIRADIGGSPASHQIRLATPYALATTWLPKWWKQWNADQQCSCSLFTGNVHDTVTAFVSGTMDLLICYHQASQPLPIHCAQCDCLILGSDTIRPYASTARIRDGALNLPGSADRPIPLLMYSPSVYFSRLIDAAIEHAPRPLCGIRVFETEMSDVLLDLAQQGLGVAWLADSMVADSAHSAGIAPMESRDWDIDVTILAWRQTGNHRAAVNALWRNMQLACVAAGD